MIEKSHLHHDALCERQRGAKIGMDYVAIESDELIEKGEKIIIEAKAGKPLLLFFILFFILSSRQDSLIL